MRALFFTIILSVLASSTSMAASELLCTQIQALDVDEVSTAGPMALGISKLSKIIRETSWTNANGRYFQALVYKLKQKIDLNNIYIESVKGIDAVKEIDFLMDPNTGDLVKDSIEKLKDEKTQCNFFVCHDNITKEEIRLYGVVIAEQNKIAGHRICAK